MCMYLVEGPNMHSKVIEPRPRPLELAICKSHPSHGCGEPLRHRLTLPTIPLIQLWLGTQTTVPSTTTLGQVWVTARPGVRGPPMFLEVLCALGKDLHIPVCMHVRTHVCVCVCL